MVWRKKHVNTRAVLVQSRVQSNQIFGKGACEIWARDDKIIDKKNKNKNERKTTIASAPT